MDTGRTMKMKMSDGKAIDVYHAMPKGARAGGLVVIQEIFGITDHIKEVCDSYAADGYEVLAPSLFDREAPGFRVEGDAEGMKQGVELAYQKHPFDLSVADAQTCIHELKNEGPVFMVGYCYGGSVVWAAACRAEGLSAASSYYGKLAPDMAGEVPRCPTICHFGKKDASIPPEAVEKLKAARPEVTVYLYDAGHAFNSGRPTHHDEASAKLARDRTLAFFKAHGG